MCSGQTPRFAYGRGSTERGAAVARAIPSGTAVVQSDYSPLTWTNPGSIPGEVAPTVPHVGIAPDDASDGRAFPGISHLSRPSIPAVLHTHLISEPRSLVYTCPKAPIRLSCSVFGLACRGDEALGTCVFVALIALLLMTCTEFVRTVAETCWAVAPRSEASRRGGVCGVTRGKLELGREKGGRWVREYIRGCCEDTLPPSPPPPHTQRSPSGHRDGETRLRSTQVGEALTSAEWRSEVSMEQRRNARAGGKLEIPEKTHRPAASIAKIPTCENPEATPPGIELVSPRWQLSSTLAAGPPRP
ncbi:hypothetical protein PR048_029633 [Dryococelus australis]|uniref:Uncharacterized protein n=1 Tax=Dryococelus australis TaxID=614101 RepID=A0ABQ9GDX7_9NEOP|nr:hypothetical protein PR048_029633 [Dryococelus australis]